jgi:hypothetical protein
MKGTCLAIAILLGGTCLVRTEGGAGSARRPEIHTEDVARFYKLYDQAGGHPTAGQLQQYLDTGSTGLHDLAKLRNVTGARMAEAMTREPKIYADAKRCMVLLPRVSGRLQAALGKLGEFYPEAKFPPVTIAVGRGKPVGVGSRSLECKSGLRHCAQPTG